MIISHRERFFGLPNPIGGLYAPLIIGAPAFIHHIDRNVFKCTKEEKAEKKLVKSMHKKELLEVYNGNVGKHLNIPSRELGKLNL